MTQEVADSPNDTAWFLSEDSRMAGSAWWQAVRQFLHPVPRRCRCEQRVRRFRLWVEVLERRLAPTVTFSISDPEPFPKPDTGQLMGLFVVTRSGEMAPAVQVDYAMQDGSGFQGAHAGIDYVATAGTLRFLPLQATATITGSAPVTVMDGAGPDVPSDQAVQRRRAGRQTWASRTGPQGLGHRRWVIEPVAVSWREELTWSLGE